MKFKTLEAAKLYLRDNPGRVAAIYRYKHLVTKEVAYLTESVSTRGTTEKSPFCRNVVRLYTTENGWEETKIMKTPPKQEDSV